VEGDTRQHRPGQRPGPSETAAETAVCPQCSEPLEEDSRFCEACGYELDEQTRAAVAVEGDDEPGAPEKVTPFPLRLLLVALWAALAVAALVWVYTRAMLLE
jgi:hypothetical protein